MVRGDRYDTYWVAKKKNLICGADGPPKVVGRAGGILSIRGPEASRESPRVDTRHVQSPTARTPPLQHIKQSAWQCAALLYKSSMFWIKSSLESPKRQRMRCRWLPTIRATPVGVRGPICIQKK